MPNKIFLTYNPFAAVLTSFFTFLEKVSKKRHSSRIASLSRSFAKTIFLLIKEKQAIYFHPLSHTKNGTSHLRQPFAFFFFWFVSLFLLHQQKKKMNKTNLLLDGGIK
ncbi:hypothetical protein [Sulfurovum sp.]|jgi:hypothetical protein|uniref:hypothetical protein n=1 Tax=Sulfurovum sp. TaxID=1969726 RepID=UPI002A36BF5C|nr:hypothetical protein [Sulfurovum sp.]MDD2451588.1 hypothetical protein [Sulfurovum sp.]MDD3500034.1 hypothetical protein [Sulfurovum sp.]MDY0402652.1 hypothetical protein [Sulfurovum sp.]